MMDTIIQHGERITQLKIPLPFPLRWVNSYLVRGNSGYTLIDPGLHTDAAVQTWTESLAKLRVDFTEIISIVLTHHHPDHYGLSGWFQERTGAPVYISRAGHDQVRGLWGPDESVSLKINELFRKHGMDDELLQQISHHFDSFIPLVSPQPVVNYLEPEHFVQLGDRSYRMIHTPGHAWGHLCFYHAESREVFCGDQVLQKISPNVSFLPDGDPDPLESFLRSLLEISQLDVNIAFPGHREPFNDFSARALELIGHHEERLNKVLELMKKPVTGFKICLALFGTRLSVHQMRFALSETIAHTVHLVRHHRAKEEERGGEIYYTAI